MFARSVAIASLAIASCATAKAEELPAQTGHQVFLETCEDWDDWSKPAPPFKVWGGTYYVGTCGISAILITTNEGHILIDGGPRDGGPLVEASIEKLGFRIEDVKILLHSHEHFDHVGGLAYLQERSGAHMIASMGALNALRTGIAQPEDPQFGMHDPFDPINVAFVIGSNNPVTLGHITLTPTETPGHTPGGLTWQWFEAEQDLEKSIVYADSLSPISSEAYRFSDHPEYLASYRQGLERLSAYGRCLLLTPHPSASWMFERFQDWGLGAKGKHDCQDYAQSIETRLDKKLAEEAVKSE